MALSKNLNTLVLVILTITITMFHGSTAQNRHVVGDSMGWTIPSVGASAYINWAANNTFTLGDTLVFNYASGMHDVARVTKVAFDACNDNGTSIFTITSSPASVTLNETGEQYYICTFGSHCSFGQKLAIDVTNPDSNLPTSPPSVSITPSSDATSIAAVPLSVTLFIAVASLFWRSIIL